MSKIDEDSEGKTGLGAMAEVFAPQFMHKGGIFGVEATLPTPWVNDVSPSKLGWIFMGFLAAAESACNSGLPIYNKPGNRSLKTLLSDYHDGSDCHVEDFLQLMADMFLAEVYFSAPLTAISLQEHLRSLSDVTSCTHVFVDLTGCESRKCGPIPEKIWCSPLLTEMEGRSGELSDINNFALLAFLAEPGGIEALDFEWGVFAWIKEHVLITRYNTFIVVRRQNRRYALLKDGVVKGISDDSALRWMDIPCPEDSDATTRQKPMPLFLMFRKCPVHEAIENGMFQRLLKMMERRSTGLQESRPVTPVETSVVEQKEQEEEVKPLSSPVEKREDPVADPLSRPSGPIIRGTGRMGRGNTVYGRGAVRKVFRPKKSDS